MHTLFLIPLTLETLTNKKKKKKKKTLPRCSAASTCSTQNTDTVSPSFPTTVSGVDTGQKMLERVAVSICASSNCISEHIHTYKTSVITSLQSFKTVTKKMQFRFLSGSVFCLFRDPFRVKVHRGVRGENEGLGLSSTKNRGSVMGVPCRLFNQTSSVS